MFTINQQIKSFLHLYLPLLKLDVKANWGHPGIGTFILEMSEVLKRMNIEHEVVALYMSKVTTTKSFMTALVNYTMGGDIMALRDFCPAFLAIQINGVMIDPEGVLEFSGYQCTVGMTVDQLKLMFREAATWDQVYDVSYIPGLRKKLATIPHAFDEYREQYFPGPGPVKVLKDHEAKKKAALNFLSGKVITIPKFETGASVDNGVLHYRV